MLVLVYVIKYAWTLWTSMQIFVSSEIGPIYLGNCTIFKLLAERTPPHDDGLLVSMSHDGRIFACSFIKSRHIYWHRPRQASTYNFWRFQSLWIMKRSFQYSVTKSTASLLHRYQRIKQIDATSKRWVSITADVNDSDTGGEEGGIVYME